MKFRVVVREIWFQGYEVEAKNKEAAERKARGGLATPIDNDLEFSHVHPDAIVEDSTTEIDE